MRAAFVYRSCQRGFLTARRSSTTSPFSLLPRQFTACAHAGIQSNHILDSGTVKVSSKSGRASPALTEGTCPPDSVLHESGTSEPRSKRTEAQSIPLQGADLHDSTEGPPSDIRLPRGKDGHPIYPPLIRELLRMPPSENESTKYIHTKEAPTASLDDAFYPESDVFPRGRGEHSTYPSSIREMLPSMPSDQRRTDDNKSPSARRVPRSLAARKLLPKNREAGIASPRRTQLPDNLAKERQREQYHLRLSYSLMKALGTLPEDFKPEFRRWKVQFGLFVRLGMNGLDPKEKSSDEKWLWELESEQDMRDEWEKLSLQEKLDQWPKVMMSSLKRCPEKAHQILSATLDYRLPPYAVLDTLRIIASVWRSRPQPLDARDDQGIAKGIVEAFIKVKETFPSLPFEQNTLGLVARALPRRHLQRLFTSLDVRVSQLSENTALQFARKLAGTIGETGEANSQRLALEILEHLAVRRAECVNTDKFKSVVTPLLHRDSLEDESQRFDTQDAFSRLWDKGFRPNVINLTVYLDTLCLAGDVKNAIMAAKMFQEYGLRFDNKVVDILFRGAKYKLDGSMVDDVIQMSKVAKLPRWRVLENAMHSIFFFHAAEERQNGKFAERDQKPFLPMLRIFAKKYQLESLQSLIPESLPLMLSQEVSEDGPHYDFTARKRLWDFEQSVVPVVDAYASSFGGKLAQPTSGIVTTMLRAYIKSLRQPYELISLWMFFKHQLEAPGPDRNTATQLVREQKSLIHDTFITEMLKHPGFKRPALEVLGDMLASKLKGQVEEYGHPAPTVFTFTILLDRLAASGEQTLANDLLQVMQENGVQPNLATMNVRVKRAAMQQNVVKTVEALAELEARFQPNEFTFKAFGWLKNQEKALKMIEEIITKRKQELGPDDRIYFEDPQTEVG